MSGLPVKAQAQSKPAADQVAGQVLDQATQAPLPYASVGVMGRSVGIVADGQGRFRLAIPSQYDTDSLRIALVGYQPLMMTVRDFRRLTCPAGTFCPVKLTASAKTALGEVMVHPQGQAVRRVLGNSDDVTIVQQTQGTL
ncbi:carboxypeptidase-like regulatory domain-containing protein [Hymenobacter terrenus]|uniref:carboxypeptidase-like regulatory domain-containing protein n=1 Tax=Hymenobacter terrenus TaxID=1629124 RepID=UPI000619D81F|nr:carboxypeptidase-like regulatory domain-containing protein [Hymenobacter terrenus]